MVKIIGISFALLLTSFNQNSKKKKMQNTKFEYIFVVKFLKEIYIILASVTIYQFIIIKCALKTRFPTWKNMSDSIKRKSMKDGFKDSLQLGKVAHVVKSLVVIPIFLLLFL